MTDRGHKLPEQIKNIAKLYLSLAEPFHDQEHRTSEGVASSFRPGDAPAKDKKTPKKKKKESDKKLAALKKKESDKKLAALKKKESDKKLAALKKKAAQEKAKHLKTVRVLEKNLLMESIKKHKEMIQKNKEKLKKLNARKK